jgi:hypothetical protein
VIELVIDTVVERKGFERIKFVLTVINGVLLIYVTHLGFIGTGVKISKSGCVGG